MREGADWGFFHLCGRSSSKFRLVWKKTRIKSRTEDFWYIV